jgi:hypothetical protein
MGQNRFFSDRPMVPSRDTRASLHAGHRHASFGRLSRRGFLQGAVGAAVVGSTVGSGLLNPRAAQAAGPGIGLAVPIPTTTEFFPGVHSHVQAPPFLEGPDSDPATVYNFQGATGIAFISGMVDRWNRRTGERRRLPYLFNDMRFMQGVFRGRDGHARNATFGFV